MSIDIKNALGRITRERMIVSLDLSDEFSQISYTSLGEKNPRTATVAGDSEDMCIPTVLAKYSDDNAWTYGYDALEVAEKGEGELVGDLIALSRKGQPVTVEGREYDPVDLLALFMKKCFNLLAVAAPIEKVAIIVITIDRPDAETIDMLNKAINTLRIKPEKVFFQSHSESAYYYMINQSRELWNHDVLICHLKEDGLYVRTMKKNLNTTPLVILMEEQNFAHIKGLELRGASDATKKKLDQAFYTILCGLCEESYVSSIYLLGQDFEDKWYEQSLNYMCKGRRVFGGNNLFGKGACYGGIELLEPSDEAKQYVFLGKDKVKANVGMKAYREGEEAYIGLIDAGKNWYETGKHMDLILDHEDTLKFIVTPLNGRNQKIVPMYLTGIPPRPPKATRVHIEIKMLSERKMLVIVNDLGFGEFYKSSGIEWKSEIVLD